MTEACSPPQVTIEWKLAALAAIEASSTFQRHEQLRAFLRFVCEYEMEGRGDQLHEYLIGVEVLGQKSGYSTTENSIVRNRAHTLRRKLAEYYATEGHEARVRIEIPKGSYCPHYVEGNGPELQISTPSPTAAPPRANANRLLFSILGIIAVGLTSFVLGYKWGHGRPANSVDPEIREAWGPLLSATSHTILCIANAPELLVRSLPDGKANYTRLPEELNLRSWYSERYPISAGESLYIVHNHNSPLWGDAAGAITVSRLLTHAGVEMEVLPERVQSAFALRDRNVVLIGRPENSPAADLFLKDLYFHMRYSPEIHDQEIYWEDPRTGTSGELARKPDTVHGLISVISRKANDGRETRLLIFSGENSAGTIAATEYFSSTERLREFLGRLHADGIDGFPRGYQVVVSAENHNYLPFNYAMETYKVIEQ
jgi:hypothetical protein